MAEQTSQQRAEQAAEELAAGGTAVTARTVRQRAKVDMAVAAAVARAWKEREAQARDVPAMPETVLTRMEGAWRDAVFAAREEFQTERDGWATRIEEIGAERDGLAEDVDRAEKERDAAQETARIEAEELRAKIAGLEEELARATAAAEQATAATAEAETRAATAEGVTAGLREALAALTPKKKD